MSSPVDKSNKPETRPLLITDGMEYVKEHPQLTFLNVFQDEALEARYQEVRRRHPTFVPRTHAPRTVRIARL